MKISPQRRILTANDRRAAANRERFEQLGLATVNVLASPGAGKTSLILALLHALPKDLAAGVIEGDVASCIDTDRIKAEGFPAVQINTAGGCHLTADMVDRALTSLNVRGPGFLFIENIGNLICPAAFDLGERLRLVVASVPEGDDRPIKYPGIFASADAVVLNKIDLLALADFDLERFRGGIRAVNPHASVFHVSCRTAEGVPSLRDWLLGRGTPAPAGGPGA
jgi:hydrogenase nickel incorporation protein HypB